MPTVVETIRMVADGGNAVETVVVGVQGEPGAAGAQGPRGESSAFVMTWDALTADADPGAGELRLNHATLASVTGAYLDNLTAAGASIASWLDSFDDVGSSIMRGTLLLKKVGAPANYALYNVTGSVVDGTGYRKLTLAHVSSAGSFTAADEIAISFSPAGAGARETLTANRTYYVRPNGSDSNTGLADTAGGAFLTIQKPLDVCQNNLDLASYIVSIQVADGTYDESLALTGLISTAPLDYAIRIFGNVTTPANVKIRPTGAPERSCVIYGSGPVSLAIDGVEIDGSAAAGYCELVQSSFGARVCLGSLNDNEGNFNLKGTAGDATQIKAFNNGYLYLQCEGAVSVSGNAYSFATAYFDGRIDIHGGINFASPVYDRVNEAFAGGAIAYAGNPTGSATGIKYILLGASSFYAGVSAALVGTIDGIADSTVRLSFGPDAWGGLGVLTKDGAPATTDLLTGAVAFFKNSVDGKINVAMNDGGTMKSVELTAAGDTLQLWGDQAVSATLPGLTEAIALAGADELLANVGGNPRRASFNTLAKMIAAGTIALAAGTLTVDSPLALTQEWNAPGVVMTAAKIDVLDTASHADSLLLDLQVGSVSKARIDKAGRVYAPRVLFGGISDYWGDDPEITHGINATTASSSYHYGLEVDLKGTGTGDLYGSWFSARSEHTSGTINEQIGLALEATHQGAGGTVTDLWAASFSAGAHSGTVTNLLGGYFAAHNVAGTVATSIAGKFQVTGAATTAYGVKVENVSAGSTNYAIYTGLGTVRLGGQVLNEQGAITTSKPFTLTQTWNAGGVTFNPFLVNITNTASAAASLLMDLQVGAATQFSVRKDGALTIGGSFVTTGYGGAGRLAFGTVATPNRLVIGEGGGNAVGIYELFFGIPGTSTDVKLVPDAVNILALRNGTNAQTLRVYATYTDASNYRRWKIIDQGVQFEAAGTGNGNQSAYFSNLMNAAIIFQTNATDRWTIQNTGHLIAGTDNAYDIGQPGVNRPRYVYVGTTVIAGVRLEAPALKFTDGGYFQHTIADGTFRLVDAASAAFGSLLLGPSGTTYNRLKHGGAGILDIRLADDSDYSFVRGKHRAHANAAAETPTATHTLRMFDAAGTEFKVLALAA